MRAFQFVAATLLFSSGSVFAADMPQLVMPVSHGISTEEQPTVARCNEAIAEWAAQYEPTSIASSLVGPVRTSSDGESIAKLFVEIEYLRSGGVEPRSATISCAVAADGQVSIAML